MACAKHCLTLTLWIVILASVRGQFQNAECVSDIQQEDCPPNTFYVEYDEKNFGGRCPGCKELQGEGGSCKNFQCAPGLKCENEFCVIDRDSCYWQIHSDDKPIYPSECTQDGKYKPVQCKGDPVIGRCFCVDENGKRIFGTQWRSEAKDMTCACSQRRAELEKSKDGTMLREDVTLHCTSDGNYEPIQCDSGLCWCADYKTGDAVSVSVPGDLISQLPCFDADTLGSQYTRVCESKAYAIAVVRKKLDIHGTTDITFEKVNCDYDGTYGSYQISKGIAFCSWKDGSRLGSWQIEAGVSVATMDCNCARDTKYFEEADKTLTQDCAGNGNYYKKQQANGRVYCVDSDGFPLTKLYPQGCDVDCETLLPMNCEVKSILRYEPENSNSSEIIYWENATKS